MKVSLSFYKKITGKIKEITKKQVKKEGEFHTPPCIVYPVPVETIYYKITLEEGGKIENRHDVNITDPDNGTNKQEIKLLFFEFRKSPEITGQSLVVGKEYQFFTSGLK